MNIKKFLLPRCFKFVGIIFFVFGVVFGIARFKYGYKPVMLDVNTFAFYSSYFEWKFMQIIRNNFGEEISGMLVITGLFLISFAREKVERDQLNLVRLKAFVVSLYVNLIFIMCSFLFTYGLAFAYALMINTGIGLVAYIIAFRILLFLNFKNRILE